MAVISTIIGGGPTTLAMVEEFIRQQPANAPKTKLIIISREPESKFGYGAMLDTVHPEVIFNVKLSGMALSASKEQANQSLDYIKSHPLSAEDQANMEALNSERKLGDQFALRYLLKGVADEMREKIKQAAEDAGIELQFVHGEVIALDDEHPHGQRKNNMSKAILTVKMLSEHDSNGHTYKEGQTEKFEAHENTILTGLPRKKLAGEEAVKDSPRFVENPHQPKEDHILHPLQKAKIADLPEDYVFGVAGTKLTAVDMAVVLDRRGYFNKLGRKLVFVSPSGEFPYPHEEQNSNADGSYEKNSLFADPNVAEVLREPKSPQQLADAMMLSVLYAVGAIYNSELGRLELPEESRDPHGVLQKIIDRVNDSEYGILNLRQETPTPESTYLKEKFAEPRERTYGWQVPIDVDFRPNMEKVWQRFGDSEKNHWFRDYEGLYNLLRHRVPFNVHKRLLELQESGQIEVIDKAVTSMRESKSKPQIVVTCGEGRNTSELRVDQMINATGWEIKRPIDEVPFMIEARKKNILHSVPNTGRMGVMIEPDSEHNTTLGGQNLIMQKKEITGGRELKKNAIDVAKAKWQKLNAHEIHEEQSKQIIEQATEEQRSKGVSPAVAKDRAELGLEFGRIFEAYQPSLERLERERIEALGKAELAASEGRVKQEKKYRDLAKSKLEEMIEVRVEASREGERRLPDFVRKYPNFLEESEMTPKDPYLPAGYRKVEIYRNEKLGVVLQVFVFGQGQETVVHFHPDSCGAVQTKGSTANTLFTLTDDGPPVPTSTIIHYAGDSGGVLGPDVLNKDGKINDGHSLRNGAAGDIPERGTLLTQAYWDNLSIRVHGYSTLDFHGRGAADSPKGYRNLLLTKKGDFVSVENPFNIEGRVSRFEDGNPQNFEVVVGLDADAKPNKTVTVPSGGRIPHSKPTGLIVRPDTAKSLKEASHLAEEKGTNQI